MVLLLPYLVKIDSISSQPPFVSGPGMHYVGVRNQYGMTLFMTYYLPVSLLFTYMYKQYVLTVSKTCYVFWDWFRKYRIQYSSLKKVHDWDSFLAVRVKAIRLR